VSLDKPTVFSPPGQAACFCRAVTLCLTPSWVKHLAPLAKLGDYGSMRQELSGDT